MNRSSFFPKLEFPDWRYALGVFAAAMLFVWHPFSGGPRVPALVLFLLGLSFWITSWRKLSADLTQRRWLLVILCLGIPALLSLPASLAPEHTALRLLLILAMFVVGSALVEIFQVPGVPTLLQKVLAVLLVFWLVDALAQMVIGYDLLGNKLNWVGRVYGIYTKHLFLQWLVVLMLPIMLWSLLPKRPYIAILLLLLSGVVVTGSGVRSAWLCWLIVATFFVLHVKVPRKWLIVSGLLSALIVAMLFSPIAKDKLEASSFGQLTFERVNKVLSARLFLWETAWHMFEDRPLTGVGADAFRPAYGAYARRQEDPFRPGAKYGPQHAHQLYISLAAETGVVGILGVVILWWLMLRWYFIAPETVRARARPYAIALLAVGFPINSQPLIYKTWWVPLLVFMVVMLLVSLRPSDSDDTGNS